MKIANQLLELKVSDDSQDYDEIKVLRTNHALKLTRAELVRLFAMLLPMMKDGDLKLK